MSVQEINLFDLMADGSVLLCFKMLINSSFANYHHGMVINLRHSVI